MVGHAIKFAVRPTPFLQWMQSEGIKFATQTKSSGEVLVSVIEQENMARVGPMLRANYKKIEGSWREDFPVDDAQSNHSFRSDPSKSPTATVPAQTIAPNVAEDLIAAVLALQKQVGDLAIENKVLKEKK